MSGVAFTPATSDWPAAYRGSLYFSDFLRKCIWRLGKLPNGDPDPSSIQVFAQQSGTPVQLVAGPGGDLYYVDYGADANGVIQGGGGVHRLQYAERTLAADREVLAEEGEDQGRRQEAEGQALHGRRSSSARRSSSSRPRRS